MELLRDLDKRVEKVRALMKKQGLNALLILKPENKIYLTGAEPGRLLITKRGAVLWVRRLYTEINSDMYFHKDYPIDVRIYEKNAVKNHVKKLKIKKLGVEDSGVETQKAMRRELKVKIIPTDAVENARAIKSEYEIGLIKKSAEIAKKGMRKAYEVVKEGASEINAVAEVEYEIRKNGSETPPFNEGAILAYGKNGANIHAISGKRKISHGLAVVDLGARYMHYYSDMTRTIKVGHLDKKERGILEFVKNLQQEAIDKIEVGMKASELHKFVEEKIKKKGFEFYHSTGHGIGIKVHELPSISENSKETFEKNMVFTVEPGIYIPHKFGVRWEDTLVLRKNKKEILTR